FHSLPLPSSRTVAPTMIPLLALLILPITTILIGCAMKAEKPSNKPQFDFKSSSNKSNPKGGLASESYKKSSDRMEESSGPGSIESSKALEPVKKEKGSNKTNAPRTHELNEKEKKIAAGAKKERNEYPTFDDVHSDWEGPLGEMHNEEKKKEVET
ncbi:hypothetical protein PFISCL1PPCAC_23739, partial [Pristionchus fissidentatus]